MLPRMVRVLRALAADPLVPRPAKVALIALAVYLIEPARPDPGLHSRSSGSPTTSCWPPSSWTASWASSTGRSCLRDRPGSPGLARLDRGHRQAGSPAWSRAGSRTGSSRADSDAASRSRLHAALSGPSPTATADPRPAGACPVRHDPNPSPHPGEGAGARGIRSMRQRHHHGPRPRVLGAGAQAESATRARASYEFTAAISSVVTRRSSRRLFCRRTGRAVHRGAVVPDHEVADAPGVAVDVLAAASRAP